MARTSVVRACIVIVCLLGSVAPASAECAWVLWERVSRGDGGVYWDIIRTYDNRADCAADFKKLLSPNSAWHAAYEPFMEDSVIMRRPNGVSTIKRALCVPGTIDPREPKASGR
jgi:hypothetical protein